MYFDIVSYILKIYDIIQDFKKSNFSIFYYLVAYQII